MTVTGPIAIIKFASRLLVFECILIVQFDAVSCSIYTAVSASHCRGYRSVGKEIEGSLYTAWVYTRDPVGQQCPVSTRWRWRWPRWPRWYPAPTIGWPAWTRRWTWPRTRWTARTLSGRARPPRAFTRIPGGTWPRTWSSLGPKCGMTGRSCSRPGSGLAYRSLCPLSGWSASTGAGLCWSRTRAGRCMTRTTRTPYKMPSTCTWTQLACYGCWTAAWSTPWNSQSAKPSPGYSA